MYLLIIALCSLFAVSCNAHVSASTSGAECDIGGGGETSNTASLGGGGSVSTVTGGGGSVSSTSTGGASSGTGSHICEPTPAFVNSPDICYEPDPLCCDLANHDMDAWCIAESGGDLPVPYLCDAVPILTPGDGTDGRHCKQMNGVDLPCEWPGAGHMICCESKKAP